MGKDAAVTVLTGLVGCALDGRDGCAEAAEQTADEELKQILTERSVEYGQAAAELHYAARALGDAAPADSAPPRAGWAQVISTDTRAC